MAKKLPKKVELSEEDCLYRDVSFKKEVKRLKNQGYKKFYKYTHSAIGRVIVFRLPKKFRGPETIRYENRLIFNPILVADRLSTTKERISIRIARLLDIEGQPPFKYVHEITRSKFIAIDRGNSVTWSRMLVIFPEIKDNPDYDK